MAYNQQGQYQAPSRPYQDPRARPQPQQEYAPRRDEYAQQPPQRQQRQEVNRGYSGYDEYDGAGFWADYGGGPVDAYVYDEQPRDNRSMRNGNGPAQRPPAQNQGDFNGYQDPRQAPPQGRPGGPGGPPNMRRGPDNNYPPNSQPRQGNGPGGYPQEQGYNQNPRMRPDPNRQRPPNLQQRSPQQQRPVRQPLIQPVSPQAMSFDNPFPVFPPKPLQRSGTAPIENGMANMNMNGRPGQDQQRPQTSHSKTSAKSTTSYQSEHSQYSTDATTYDNASLDSRERFQGRPSLDQQRGPPPRSATMPNDMAQGNGDRRLPPQRQQGDPQEFGFGARTRDPVEKRSNSSMGTRQEPNFGPPARSQTSFDIRPGGNPNQMNGAVSRPPISKRDTLDEYMPDFGSSPEAQAPLEDPIGLPLDTAPGIRTMTPLQRSRSQPDIRGDDPYNQGAPPGAPAVPGLPIGMSNSQRIGSPGPGYGQSQRDMGPGNPRYGPPSQRDGLPSGPSPARPGGLNRINTDQSAWSDPGPRGAMEPMSAPVSGPPRGHALEQAPKSANPDALPAHPMPVRPGLMQNGGRAPPGRQPGGAAESPRGGPGPNSASGGPPQQEQAPITHQELFRLREHVKNAPSDYKVQLVLAKRLVEASQVLADEEGRADAKTRTKNRERFVFEAHKVIKKLVNHSYPDAMFFLADCYGTGQLGLAVDPKEAFTLYQGAAKLGHAAAAYRTAVCCEMGGDVGGGTRRDPLKAVQWYRRAAALGDVPAMYKLGMILLKGMLGQQSSVGEAMIWLNRAAERADEDNPHAVHELAQLHELAPLGGKVIRDEAYALQLYEQGARLGYRLSQARLGKVFEYGQLGCPVDNRASIHWYSKAAAQEEPEAEIALSGWYLTGTPGILEQSDTEAYLWARKAAQKELPKAEFAMGYFSEVGIGCPRSLDDAKRWYGRAASHNYPKAKERLEELRRGGSKAQKGRERISRSGRNEDCVVM